MVTVSGHATPPRVLIADERAPVARLLAVLGHSVQCGRNQYSRYFKAIYSPIEQYTARNHSTHSQLIGLWQTLRTRLFLNRHDETPVTDDVTERE